MIRAQVPRSRLPKLLYGMMSDRGGAFADLARRYPDGVTVPLPGRPLHVLNGPEAVKHVLVTAADRYEKGVGQAEARAGLGRGILTDEGETWLRARGSLGPWLRARRIQQHAPAIHRHAVDSVTELAGPHPRRMPVDGLLAEYTLRCLATVLGVPAPHVAPILEALDIVQDDAMFRVVTQDRIPAVLRPRAEQRLREARTVLDRAADEIIAAVGAAADTPDGSSPAWADRDGVISLLLAGYETTSSTLAWAVDELSRRPALADALAEEREAADDPTDDPADLLRLMGQLRLTTAVIKEVLRLHPAVWLVSRRACRDDVVAGWPIRTGDDVCVVIAEVQQQGWAAPDLFDPARFLTNDHGRYLPFGLGPRGCPGASLAHLEATLWLAEASRRLTLRPALGRRTRALARMSMTTMPGTPYLIARRSVARAVSA
ncbi:cytochrome P450 [Nocardia sp. 004]|uniref:cytochrome P450 n=1 Tax=Nocardia sp. 004 TaxID=3385978 RepID=UPI00399F50FC